MSKFEKRLMAITAAAMAFVAFFAFCRLQAKIADLDRITAPTARTEPQIIKVEPGTWPTEPEEEEPEVEDLGEFKLTAYCACPVCCGEWADGITYTGTEATAGRTVAVDPEVIPLGSSLYIFGHEYKAEDIGGAVKGNRVDIFFDNHEDALQFGVQYADVALVK